MAFINGPAVKSFQTEPSNYLGGAEVIACTNGTDALQIAMMALGLQPGDEVITANFTCVATAEIIALLQLKPVLVAVGPVTFNIDIEYILADIAVVAYPRARHEVAKMPDAGTATNLAAGVNNSGRVRGVHVANIEKSAFVSRT